MSSLIQSAIDVLNKKPSYLVEALTPEMERKAERMSESGRDYYLTNFINTHAAPGTLQKFQYDKDTSKKVIRIPIKLNQDKPDPSHTVQNFLKEKGYLIKDIASYRAGLAHKEVVTGNPEKGIPYRTKMQPYKIGGLLSEHNAPNHVVHAYTHDPVRVGGKNQDFDLVITNHPHDVYGMSTGRGWTSCAQMEKGKDHFNGLAAQKMPEEINNFTHVAYLTPRGGNYDTNAIARLAFKHHTAINLKADTNEGQHAPNHQTLISEGTVYGQAPTDFRSVAEHEMGKLFPIKKDVYIKNPNVYNDNGKTLHVPEGINVAPEHLDAAWKTVPKDVKTNLYRYVGVDGKYKSKKLRDVQSALKNILQEPTGNFLEDFDRVKHSTLGLDKEQKSGGIEDNMNVDRSVMQNSINKVMSSFDLDNPDHTMALRTVSYDHPLRHNIFEGITNAIPTIKTAQDFDKANKIHKLVGNRESERFDVAHDHSLGDDPIKALGKAGVLRDANDYRKAYYTFHEKSAVKGNWYDHAYRLAQDNVPNAHLAAQEALNDLDKISKRFTDRDIATSYHFMGPEARRYYSNQLGHDVEKLFANNKEHLAELDRRMGVS